jgi:alpha-glucosidase
LVETKSNKWALISESDVSNYPLSSGQLKDNALQFVFSNDKIAENKTGSNFSSPWRVIILGENLGNVVESCVIDHLAPPTKMKDLSWVEPGVTSFPWWGNNLANSYPDTLKKYFDLSAEMNWRYVEFDIPLIGSPARAAEYWKSADWIKDVVDYGLEKGVLCYGWDDIKNLNTPEKRDTIFSKYNEFGVRGIKVDFVNSYTQQSRKLVEEVIQDAAKHKLMVSFHGAQSPRGFARTYPHVVTFEAVKGSEYYLEINGAKGVPASHNCILPFTRNVLGSMDYTPVAFSSKIRETTMAHQLALSVIF